MGHLDKLPLLKLEVDVANVLDQVIKKFEVKEELANPSLRTAIDYLDSIKIPPLSPAGKTAEGLQASTQVLKECADHVRFPQFCVDVCNRISTELTIENSISTIGAEILANHIELELETIKEKWMELNSPQRQKLLEYASGKLNSVIKGFFLAHESQPSN